VLCALIAGSPFFLVTHTFTTKPSGQLLAGPLHAAATLPTEIEEQSSGTGPLFAVHLDRQAPLRNRMVLGAKAIGVELAHAFLWVGWLPALLGLWWCRERYRTVPGTWLLLVLFLMHMGLVWLLAVRVGYVSDRHVLLLVLCCLFQAVAVAIQIPFRVGAWIRTRQPLALQTSKLGGWRPVLFSTSSWALMLLLVFAGMSLSRTLKPLHANRAGQHQAGEWLKTHTEPVDVIFDDHCWAHYYAGRVFREGLKDSAPPGYTPAIYVVYTKGNDERHGPANPRDYNRQDLIQRNGQVVYRWPEAATRDEAAAVLIYRLSEPLPPKY
jgi:hypothetical protein